MATDSLVALTMVGAILVGAFVVTTIAGTSRLTSAARRRMVLRLLGSGDRYGLELVELSSGLLKRGSVYVLLSRLEDEGLVEGYHVHGYMPHERRRLRRRRYRLTPVGRIAQGALQKGDDDGE